MSVVAPSPFARSKRRLDENHDQPVFDSRGSTPSSAKKARPHWAPSCPSRCVSFASEGGVYALSPSALAALLSLFPLMDEKVVTDVLSDCGNDINAAIKRLEELKLSSEAAANAAAAATVAAAVQGHHHSPAQQPAGPVPLTSEIEPHQEPASAQSGGPQTGEQWVELLVQQMASARDMGDARAKGGAVLQQFEGFVTARTKADAEAKLNVLHKENGILKRAVQIQNTKLQEKAQQEQGQQHQLQQLQHMLVQYQEQVRTLQLSNYSLTLHLQKATSSNVVSTQRGPDVF